MRTSARGRPAFTLIELLVVISIMAALLALSAFAVSALAPSFRTSNGADLVQGWTLSSRQMARRDGVPTGVRFLVDGDNICRRVQYVRQPDDVAQGVYVGRDSVSQGRVRMPAGTSFPAMAGDYLELYNGGVIRLIVGVSGKQAVVAGFDDYVLTVNPSATGGVDLPDTAANPATAGVSPTNYRIIRQPQPIIGEADLKLPENVGVDFSVPTGGWNGTTTLSNPPRNEIVFGPSGAVIGQGTTTGMIYLWVRRVTNLNGKLDPDNSSDHLAGKPVIVTVYTRTGAIASHPVSRKTDPFEFTRDGKGSGL